MTRSENWTWEFRPPAAETFEDLESHVQDRPHWKVRVGDLRLGADADAATQTLVIYDIEHQSGAYKPGDAE